MNDPEASVPAKERDAVVESTRMTFGEHLNELRSRLIRSVVAGFAAFVGTMLFAEDLFKIVVAPFRRVMIELYLDPTLKASGPTTTFVTYLKVGLMAAIAIAAPIWLYQLWAFIASGLYDREKRPIKKYFPLSILLFASGVLFGYFALLPTALRYLMTFADPGLVQNWTGISEYLSLFFTLTVMLGLMFELPVVMLGLAKSGFVTSEFFRAKRKIVILGIFIVAGILTPPDPITQPLVAVPLCGLYELGIIAAMAAEGRKRAPINWKSLFKRVRWPLAAVLLAFGFRDRIARLWRGADADARAESAEVRTGVPWRPAARYVLGAVPDGAFRVIERADETLVLASGGGRAALLRFKASKEQSVAVPTDSRSLEILHVQAGAVLWHAEVASDVPYGEALLPLCDALEDGADETRAIVRRLLAAAIGRALDADDARAAAEARAWISERADRPFPAPEFPTSAPSNPR